MPDEINGVPAATLLYGSPKIAKDLGTRIETRQHAALRVDLFALDEMMIAVLAGSLIYLEYLVTHSANVGTANHHGPSPRPLSVRYCFIWT